MSFIMKIAYILQNVLMNVKT